MKEKFPGFQACIEMMRKHDPQKFEDGFGWLLQHVNEFIDDLIIEFLKEENHKIRHTLLELIGYSTSPKAFEILVQELRNDERSLREWAIFGLKRIGTKEAKQVLREARYYELSTPEGTRELREDLNDIIGPEQPWEKYTRPH